MKDMEASEMVAIPASESKESPQSTMAPDPVSTVDEVSVTKGATPIPATDVETMETNGEVVATNVEAGATKREAEATNVEAVATKREAVTTNEDAVLTNGETVVEEKKESSVHTGEKVISQPNKGIKRTKGSLARDLKKIRLCKDSDEEDNPDDPLPQVNGDSSNDRIQNELQKKIESIPEKTREMEKAQTEGIIVLEEANEVLQANDDKENTEYKKQETKLKSKLRRLSRKELENMIIRKLNEKICNEHELGKLKQLSEKLKYTLENNKKKTAQFYKEVDDLKKVTQKLMQDHQARKGQYVTPIRTQRSVGIHANEKYIRQGSMYVSNGTGPYKIISPSPGLSVSKGPTKPSQQITTASSTIQTQTAQPVAASTPVQTYRAVTATSSSGNPQMLRPNLMVQPPGPVASVTRSPMPMVTFPRTPMVQVPRSAVTGAVCSSNTNTVNSLGSSLMSLGSNRIPAQIVTSTQGSAMQNAHRQMVMQQSNSTMIAAPSAATRYPITAASTNNPSAITTARTNTSGGFIDLTEKNLGNHTSTIGNLHVRTDGNLLTTPNTVVNAPAPGMGTTVRPALIQTPGGGTQQVLLVQQLPTNGGLPNTILVSNAGSPVTTGLTTTLVSRPQLTNTHSSLNNPPSVLGGFNSVSAGSNPPAGAFVAAANAVATATSQVVARHPAPLPPPPPHLLSAIKHSPPILTLKKVAGKENSIVLSWNMNKADNHSCVGHYHLYSYQEGTAQPVCKLWKKVGMVQALELPMACTLTQFTPGHIYHFAVRAVYGAGRVGPFSEPRSIHLAR